MAYIRRGTTPTHTFTGSTDLAEATALYVTYQQGGKTVVEKTLDDVTLETDAEECTVTVTLTQAETLAFDEKRPVEIQIRVLMPDGSALASNIINTSPARLLKEGVI